MDEINLSVWLDRQVRQIYVPPSELIRWLREAITHLTKTRGIPMSALWRAKYPLAQKLEAKIKVIRQEGGIRHINYACSLPRRRRAFRSSMDLCSRKRCTLTFGSIAAALSDFGTISSALTMFPPSAAKAMKAKNSHVRRCSTVLTTKSNFGLGTLLSTSIHFGCRWRPDFFTPDFVAKLKDGRIFIVEYKGEHLAGSGNDDTNEKRLVGALWEKASGGKGLFAMIEREVDGRDMRGQLLDAINRNW